MPASGLEGLTDSPQKWLPYGRWVVQTLRRYHDRDVAVIDGHTYTYDNLAKRVSQLVQSLERLGLKPGDGVGLLGFNSFDYLALLLAIPVAGLRYTPLHPLGSAEDHLVVIDETDLVAVVIDPSSARDTAEVLATHLPQNRILTIGAADVGTDVAALADTFDHEPLTVQAPPDGIVAIMCTGGTTGRPKGAIWGDNSFFSMTFMPVIGWDLPPTPRLIISTPLSHAALSAALPVLALGGTLHVLPSFSAEAFLDIVEHQGADCAFVVPTALYALLDSPTIRSRDLSSLKTLVYGAAPISSDRLKEAMTFFGPILVQNYGQTETSHITSMRKFEHDITNEGRLVSCGRPHFGVDVRVMDSDGIESPAGEVGEICVRSPGAMLGYYKRPVETAETIVEGWIRTGDVGRVAEDGFVYLMDRSKDMIVTGGFNVYPRAVEEALDEHPSVLMSAVFGIPHEKWGEAVTAVVVPRPGADLTVDELKAYVRTRKGALMVPKTIDFVEALPVTAVGKVDKKALRAPYWAEQSRGVGG